MNTNIDFLIVILLTDWPIEQVWQRGGPDVFRGFITRISEEARTRGWLSPSFGGFYFFVLVPDRRPGDCLKYFKPAE
jgi:hypothetical protein